jgi:hypothetical protein
LPVATTTTVPASISLSPSASTWLKLAVVYLIVGVSLGIAMGATENFLLRPVHTHLNLLGFTTVALAGLVYRAYPAAAESRLARAHFWLHNTAVPVMMASLAILLSGHREIVPVLVVSEFVAAAGVLVFAVNVFRNVQPVAAARTGR